MLSVGRRWALGCTVSWKTACVPFQHLTCPSVDWENNECVRTHTRAPFPEHTCICFCYKLDCQCQDRAEGPGSAGGRDPAEGREAAWPCRCNLLPAFTRQLRVALHNCETPLNLNKKAVLKKQEQN